MGVAWHTKWENFGLITSAEGLVREIVAYDKMSLVRIIYVHIHVVLVIKMASHLIMSGSIHMTHVHVHVHVPYVHVMVVASPSIPFLAFQFSSKGSSIVLKIYYYDIPHTQT